MENIVVVGGGHVGLTLAVDLELRKNETRLSPHVVLLRNADHPILARPKGQAIEVEDILSGGVTRCDFPSQSLHGISTDLGAIIADTRAIVITVPDIPRVRKDLLAWVKSCKPHKDTSLVLVRSGQGGQISVVDEWRRDPLLRQLNVILIEDSFYGTRYLEHKIAFKRKLSTKISVFGPSPDRALGLLGRMFSGPSVGADMHRFVVVRPLDLQFDPLGYIIHLGVALDPLNLNHTRNGVQYLHYPAGIHEANADRLEALDLERLQMAARYGARTMSFREILKVQYGLRDQSSFLELMRSTRTIYRSLSAPSIDALRQGRIIQEDVPGLLVMEWLAKHSGQELPKTMAHAHEIRGALRQLDVDIAHHDGYVRHLEERRFDRRQVVDLLSDPA